MIVGLYVKADISHIFPLFLTCFILRFKIWAFSWITRFVTRWKDFGTLKISSSAPTSYIKREQKNADWLLGFTLDLVFSKNLCFSSSSSHICFTYRKVAIFTVNAKMLMFSSLLFIYLFIFFNSGNPIKPIIRVAYIVKSPSDTYRFSCTNSTHGGSNASRGPNFINPCGSLYMKKYSCNE